MTSNTGPLLAGVLLTARRENRVGLSSEASWTIHKPLIHHRVPPLSPIVQMLGGENVHTPDNAALIKLHLGVIINLLLKVVLWQFCQARWAEMDNQRQSVDRKGTNSISGLPRKKAKAQICGVFLKYGFARDFRFFSIINCSLFITVVICLISLLKFY